MNNEDILDANAENQFEGLSEFEADLTPPNPTIDPRITELTEALARERADSINIKRRSDEAILKAGNAGKVSIVKKMLPLLDTYEKAVASIPESLAEDKYVAGLGSLLGQYQKILLDEGLEKISAVGVIFNPELHQALQVRPSSNKKDKPGTIAEELQSGYIFNGEILRVASVVVWE